MFYEQTGGGKRILKYDRNTKSPGHTTKKTPRVMAIIVPMDIPGRETLGSYLLAKVENAGR